MDVICWLSVFYTYRHTNDGRSVSLEYFEFLSVIDVPASDGLVGGSREQDFTGCVDGHTCDRALVLLKYPDALTSLEGPCARSEIGRAGDEYVLVSVPIVVFRLCLLVVEWNEYERVHTTLVTAEHADTFTGVEVPAARRPVVRRAEHEVAGTDDPVDERIMSAEHVHAITRAHVPLTYGLVGGPCEHIAVLDHNAVDVILVPLQDPDTFAPIRLGRPETSRTVLTTCSQHRSILTHAHAVDPALVLV